MLYDSIHKPGQTEKNQNSSIRIKNLENCWHHLESNIIVVANKLEALLSGPVDKGFASSIDDE